MKKIILFVFGFLIILSGCQNSDNKNQKKSQKSSDTNLSAISENLDKNIEEISKKTENATIKLTQDLTNATQNAIQKAEELKEKTKQTTQEILETSKEFGNRTIEKTKEIGQNVINATKDIYNNTKENFDVFMEDKVKPKIDEINSDMQEAINFITTTGDIENGKKVYAKCISCHGANANIEVFRRSQDISKWSKDNIVAALEGYKNGTYGGKMKATMRTLVKNLSEKEIYDVATYIESLGNNARNN